MLELLPLLDESVPDFGACPEFVGALLVLLKQVDIKIEVEKHVASCRLGQVKSLLRLDLLFLLGSRGFACTSLWCEARRALGK